MTNNIHGISLSFLSFSAAFHCCYSFLLDIYIYRLFLISINTLGANHCSIINVKCANYAGINYTGSSNSSISCYRPSNKRTSLTYLTGLKAHNDFGLK